MTSREPDPHLRPDHPYPPLPPGVRICDDDVAAGDYFFYRDRELVVHAEDFARVQESLRVLGVEQRHYERTSSAAERPLVRLQFRAEAPGDTIDLFRRLRFGDVADGSDHEHEPAAPGEVEPATPRVWPNYVVGLQYHTKWGAGSLPRPHSPLSPLPTGDNLPGAGVRVGVLDSGIEDQAWFDQRWSPAAGRSRADVEEQPGAGSTLPYQCGHGTFCTGIVLQHAPGAHVVVDRVDSTSGILDDWQLHLRLSALLGQANEVDVLNLSLGGYTADNRPLPCTGDVLTAALEANPDLVVVASAGNDGRNRPVWPAAMRAVVGVGAVGADGRRWPLSNFGEWVNAWSAGEDVPSTFLSWPSGPPPQTGSLDPGPTDPTAEEQCDVRFDGWATWAGTSFAAARVSGAVAAELRRDGRSPREVVFDLVTNAAVPFESGGLVVPATYVS
jgi:Subtilase family